MACIIMICIYELEKFYHLNSWHQIPLEQSSPDVENEPFEMLAGRLYAEPHSHFPAKDSDISQRLWVGESRSTRAKRRNLLCFS